MEKSFRIDGIDCANCAAKIERALSKLSNVEKVNINFMTGKMLLAADEQAFDEVYANAVRGIFIGILLCQLLILIPDQF